MGVWENIKRAVAEKAEENAERKRFRKYVEQQTLPIKRQAYLEERLKQAALEGKQIASQELVKKQEPRANEFNLPTNLGKHEGIKVPENTFGDKLEVGDIDPFKFIKKQEKEKTKSRGGTK